MKLDQKIGTLIKPDCLIQKQFSIRASAKAFEAIYGKLYSNNIKAIIRELSCNAYDSHVEANKKDVPFDVKLPNALDLEFYIRDYGTGISPENIEKVYTVCFESTKTDTNEQIGCLGLGSKTPFSYTDNFIVESFYNGKKYTYTMYLDKERNPSFTLVATTQTKEPNGLLVKFSTKRDDYNKWLVEAKEVYTYFENVPNIIGNANFKNELNKIKPELEFDNFKIYKSDYYTCGAVLVMGNIGYKVEGDYSNFGTSSYKVVAKIGIGDVDFTTSREALEYTTKTINKINSLIADFKKKISSVVEKQIDNCANYWEAFLEYNKLSNLYPLISINYKGKLVQSQKLSFPSVDYNIRKLRSYTQTLKHYDYQYIDTSSLIGATIFIASEKSPKYITKFRDYIEANHITSAYLIKAESPKGDFQPLKDVDIYPKYVIDLDILPAPPKKTTTSTTSLTRVKNCVQGYVIDANGKKGIENVSLLTPEYYIKCNFTNYDSMQLNGKSLQGYDAHTLVSLIDIINKLTNQTIRVIAVTESNLAKAQTGHQWVAFEDYFNSLQPKFEKEVKKINQAHVRRLLEERGMDDLNIKHNCWLKKLVENTAKWKTNILQSNVNKAAEYWKNVRNNTSKFSLQKVLSKKYPLLDRVSLYSGIDKKGKEAIADYINLLEEKRRATRNIKSSTKQKLPTNVVI